MEVAARWRSLRQGAGNKMGGGEHSGDFFPAKRLSVSAARAEVAIHDGVLFEVACLDGIGENPVEDTLVGFQALGTNPAASEIGGKRGGPDRLNAGHALADERLTETFGDGFIFAQG